MKNVKTDFLLIVLLLLISGFTWRHIPSLQFQGEGFYYFMTLLDPISNSKSEYDVFALSFFKLIDPIFRDQVDLYMWFQLISMLFMDLFIYILVRVLTENRFAGFITAFLFSTSFIGKFDMFSGGGYQYFVQRGILLLFLLPAFFFFILYFKYKFSMKYYILGLIFFLIGVSMGFFASWFLPVFIIYPSIYSIFNFKKFKNLFWKVIWVPIPFIIGNIFIIKQSNYVPQGSLFEFVINRFMYIVIGILQQLTVITFPMGEFLFQFKKQSIEYFITLGFALFLYIGAFFVSFRIQKDLRIFQITVLTSAIAMLFLNLYLNASEVLSTFRSTRYFYYPSSMISIFWGISLAGIFAKEYPKKKFIAILLSLFFILFFVSWFTYNNIHIQKRLKDEEWIHKANKKTIEILRSWSNKTKNQPSYIYLPQSLGGYGGDFAFHFYSHPEGDIAIEGLEVLDLDKLAKSGLSPENLYVLHFDPKSKQVVDKTYEKRELLIKMQKK